jgi:NHLM bacteriocin system ABC transporter ATP-binding protein
MSGSSTPNSNAPGRTPPEGHEHGLRLVEPGSLFRARGGGVDIFAAAFAGEVQTARLPLFRVEDGEALIGLGQAGGLCLLAVPAAGARIEVETFDGPTALSPAVDLWIERLVQALDISPPAQVKSIAAPGMWTLEAGSAGRPASQVVWVWTVSGEAAFLGAIPVPQAGDPPLALTSRSFVTAAAQTTLQATTTEPLLAAGIAQDGLGRLFAPLGERLLPLFAARIEAIRQQERTRFETRQSLTAALWERTQARLDRVLTEDEPIAAATDWDRDDVFDATRLIAAAAGVRAVAPRGEGALPKSAVDRLEAIGRATRFRVRAITLEAGWWRGEVTPCVALRADGSAAAVLPGRRGRAMLVDAATGRRGQIDAAVAKGLLPDAFALHWLLPTDRITAGTLLAFGLRNKTPMVRTIFGAAIIGALLGLILPLITGTVVGRVIPNAEMGQLGQLLALLLGAAMAAFCFALTRALTLLRLQGVIDSDLQCALWDRLLGMPAPFFGGMAAGDLANRALAINWISTALGGPLLGAVVTGVAAVPTLIIMAYYSLTLTLVGLLLIAFALTCCGLIVRAMVDAQGELLSAQGKLIGLELQLLTSANKFQVAGATSRIFAKWAELFAAAARAGFEAGRPQARLAILIQLFQPLATLVMLSAITLIARDIATADFVAFSAAFGQFLGMMTGLISALVAAAVAVPLYRRARPILETPPEDAAGKMPPGALSGAITLRDVHFRYTQDGPLVLNGLDLDIHPHEFIAIAGPSGSGKSTLLRLLLGFERPEAGEIAFDRTSLDDLDPRLLRQQIGVVMQLGRLTPGSLFDNIANHGRHTMDDAWEAADQAGLADTIRRMPMGMQTYVSEGASTLSGGERQRLMIARAFIRKPRILLFDEATSALDNETQAIVTASLAKLTCTRIVIAHRISTIQSADRIIVVSGGKVSEEGDFQSLMAQRGAFYALATRQLV